MDKQMLNPHESLGIAQTIFYIPIVPAAIRLMRRNGQIRPRLAWWPLIPFSLIRLAGGPVTIALEKSPSIGLYSAAIILLNVGVVPLIIATLGFVRIMQVHPYILLYPPLVPLSSLSPLFAPRSTIKERKERYERISRANLLLDNHTSPSRTRTLTALMRGTIAAAICLLAAGGGISSLDTPFGMHLSRTLTLVGYIVFAVMHIVLIGIMGFYWRRRKTLLPSSRIVLRGGLLASPFLITRTIFGLLEVALQDDSSSPFNPVVGNAVAFALMALLPEYVVVLVYLHTGFSVAPDRGVVREVVEEETGTITCTQEAV
ncbi:hypothetical protein CCMA1212_005444 [Trichoderma ghanense]|uniref:DUF7702 domain-containing protein n=1 Tax=Trichoderma ghanense TaxID=65468 RepID=A0ABY2H395_9HYPO